MLLCVVASAGDAIAQQASVDAAKRIEQMRDQAALGSTPAGLAPVDTQGDTQEPTDALATDAAVEPEALLPANEMLPLGAGESSLFDGQAEQSGTGALNDGWLLSTLASLGVVLAIVFGIRFLLRRGGVVSTAAPQGGVVEVLSRTTVAPRSHVVLMRIGTRILVVSDSTAGMRTLASVEDAAEVAELLGGIESAKPTSMSQSFGSVMKKLSGQWSGDEEAMEGARPLDQAAPESQAHLDLQPHSGSHTHPDPHADQATGALSRVRGRLAAMSDIGGRS